MSKRIGTIIRDTQIWISDYDKLNIILILTNSDKLRKTSK